MRFVRRQFATPEHIDDDPRTAPSKRILSKLPGYDKVSAGPSAAVEIGLAKLRAECTHFNAWIQRLENLGQR